MISLPTSVHRSRRRKRQASGRGLSNKRRAFGRKYRPLDARQIRPESLSSFRTRKALTFEIPKLCPRKRVTGKGSSSGQRPARHRSSRLSRRTATPLPRSSDLRLGIDRVSGKPAGKSSVATLHLLRWGLIALLVVVPAATATPIPSRAGGPFTTVLAKVASCRVLTFSSRTERFVFFPHGNASSILSAIVRVG